MAVGMNIDTWLSVCSKEIPKSRCAHVQCSECPFSARGNNECDGDGTIRSIAAYYLRGDELYMKYIWRKKLNWL